MYDFGDFRNYIKVAVDRVGGPTKAAHKIGVSNATIHSWIVQRRVPQIEKATALAEASGIELQKLRSTK